MLVIGGAVANGLRTEVPENANATITLTDLPSDAGKRMVAADVRITPADLISDDPEWVTILSWQGGLANDRGLVIDKLEKVGPGHYRSTQPIPVWGSWKTLLRVQDGNTMAAVPIFLPADPGIGAVRGARRGVEHPAVRPGDHHPAARAQPRPPVVAVHRRRRWWCWSARWC